MFPYGNKPEHLAETSTKHRSNMENPHMYSQGADWTHNRTGVSYSEVHWNNTLALMQLYSNRTANSTKLYTVADAQHFNTGFMKQYQNDNWT